MSGNPDRKICGKLAIVETVFVESKIHPKMNVFYFYLWGELKSKFGYLSFFWQNGLVVWYRPEASWAEWQIYPAGWRRSPCRRWRWTRASVLTLAAILRAGSDWGWTWHCNQNKCIIALFIRADSYTHIHTHTHTHLLIEESYLQ